MDTRNLRGSRLAVCGVVVSWAVLTIAATDARAITFGQWATNQGWPAGYVTPAAVYAPDGSIDSLAGIGNYNWTATPTTTLDLYCNQITSIESGAFSGLGSLTTLDLYYNQITSIESGDFSGLGSLTDPEFVLQPDHEHRIGRLQRAGQLDVPGFGQQPDHEHRIGRLQRAGQLDVPGFGQQPDHEHRIGRLQRAGQLDAPWIWAATRSRASNRATSAGWAA